MNNKFSLTFLFLLLNLFTIDVFSQQSGLKIQFSVTDDNGNFVSGLKYSDMQISQGKKILAVTNLEERNDNPLEVVIIIDASASQERMIPAEKVMAEIIVNKILKPEKDKVAVATLTGTVSLVQPLTNDFQKAKGQIRKIEFEPPTGYIGGGVVASGMPSIGKDQMAKGSTSIWESIKEIIKSFPEENKSNARRVIILMSDGVNTYGDAKLKEAVEASVKSRIPIYAIGIGDSKYAGVDKGTLEKLTGQTGGILILPKEKIGEFENQIKQTESPTRSFYEATFTPDSSGKKDSLQETEIKLINPELGKRKLRIVYPKKFYSSN